LAVSFSMLHETGTNLLSLHGPELNWHSVCLSLFLPCLEAGPVGPVCVERPLQRFDFSPR
jgi:hypothetical protein